MKRADLKLNPTGFFMIRSELDALKHLDNIFVLGLYSQTLRSEVD